MCACVVFVGVCMHVHARMCACLCACMCVNMCVCMHVRVHASVHMQSFGQDKTTSLASLTWSIRWTVTLKAAEQITTDSAVKTGLCCTVVYVVLTVGALIASQAETLVASATLHTGGVVLTWRWQTGINHHRLANSIHYRRKNNSCHRCWFEKINAKHTVSWQYTDQNTSPVTVLVATIT